MQSSMFNTRVPLPGRDETFLLNTLTDARLLVSNDVVALLDRAAPSEGSEVANRAEPRVPSPLESGDRETLEELASHGFIVESRDTERAAVDSYFRKAHEDTSMLEVTVLTTLQCNFACDYCIQGDHGDYNKHAKKMSFDTARRTCEWVEQRLDEVNPETFMLRFFGGEPLLNLPVLYEISERLWNMTRARGVKMSISIVTNGLLLTPEVVDRLEPFGLGGFKVTLDGDQAAHDRMRPLRGGQGTFDKIIENVRQVAHRYPIAIGGNFDESTVDSFPALLDFLKEQDFADSLVKVSFKPVIREPAAAGGVIPPAAVDAGVIPLTAVDAGGKPLGGACMTAAGAGHGASLCDTCGLADEKWSFLREETKKRGFYTPDGLQMGPCEIHRLHSYTVDPDGSLYACPGFASDTHRSVGHIDGRTDPGRTAAARTFDVVDAWRACGDCSFIPVCAGGCSVAAESELGGIDKPSCHKSVMESALTSLAYEAAGVPAPPANS